MKTKRVIINFMRLAIAALIVFGRSVVAKMTGNANFINPNPKLVDVTAAIDDMEAKAALAKDGSKTDKSNAKVAKKKAVDILRQLAWWVEGVANGDENILTSSGFMLSKDPEPSQRDDFFIFGGTNPGDLLIGCMAYPKAGAYIWYHSLDDKPPVHESDWIFAGASTQRRTYLKGYTSGTKIWFRVRPLTKDGLEPEKVPILFTIK